MGSSKMNYYGIGRIPICKIWRRSLTIVASSYPVTEPKSLDSKERSIVASNIGLGEQPRLQSTAI